MRYRCCECMKSFEGHEVIYTGEEYYCQKCFGKDDDNEDEDKEEITY